MVVGDIVLHNKNLYPNRIGVIDEDDRLTWKEVNDRVNKLVNAFRGLGLKKGEAVAMLPENHHFCVEFFFGVAKAGLVGTIVNYRLPSHQIRHILNDCRAKAIFVQNKSIGAINSIRPNLETVKLFIGMGQNQCYPYDYEVLLSENSSDEPNIEVDENDIFWIGYTSGTTGMPKGAIFTHRSRVENCIYHDICCQLNPGDVAILDVPVHGFAGLVTLGGLTFASSTATFLTFDDVSAGLAPDATDKQKRRLDSVGKPLMGCRIKIVDENNHEVPNEHQGEIILKSPCMMSGYLNLPDLTREAFRGEPGWYYTIDLGMFDEDGYLYLRGRKDFMVKTGGFNVFPAEVESVALTHPAITEAAMFGVPDERWTNAVNLAVVLKPGLKATEEEIIEHCRKHLAGYQTPKAVYIMDALPKDLSSSKVLRTELRKIYGKESI